MAKTYNNLYAKVIDHDNVVAAISAAARGKRGKRVVRRCLANPDDTANRVIGMIEREDYGFPQVRDSFEINDGVSMKRRTIIHPSFFEQIIDHAFLQILAPIFRRRFDSHSYGSVPGQGQEGMAKYVMRKVRRRQDKVRYYAVLDVRKCFDTISADAIYREVSTHYVRDARVLAWVRAKLNANAVRKPNGEVVRGGVPIGLYTSPWFVNVMMSRVDRVFKDRFGVYLMCRYIDDIMVMHGNRRVLARAIAAAGEELAAAGMHWKGIPVVRRWACGDVGKIRFCGMQITRNTCEVRDAVYIRAVRAGARIVRKAAARLRVTWYDAAKIISYGGRFRSFESWNAFVRNVLKDGKVKYSSMRKKISAHDKLKAKGAVENENV